MDSELEPIRLVQAEALDNLMALRFVTFSTRVRFDPIETVLYSLDGGKQIGTLRSFWSPMGNVGTVMFLVTLDYGSAERLLLEQDQLGLGVDYAVTEAKADEEEGNAIEVQRFGIIEARLVQMPQKPLASPTALYLNLRPVKQWRWA